VPTIAPLLLWAAAEMAKMNVNKKSSGRWADDAGSFLIFGPRELKARHKRRGVTRALLVKLFLKPTWIDRGEWLITSVLALQN
jgi:hypothetical protein